MHAKRWQLAWTIAFALVMLGAIAAMGQAKPAQTFSLKFGEPRETGPFSGGGGPLCVGALLDLSALEASLTGVHFKPDLGKNGVFLLHGGGGFGGDEQIRWGGLGAGATWTTRVENNSEFDKAEFSLGYSGLTIERLLEVHRLMAASVGALLGHGSFDLELSRSVSGNFSQVTTRPNSVQLKRSFFFAQPYLSAEYKVLGFAALRVTLGYWFSISFSPWHLANGQEVPGGPLTSLGMPVIQFMLVFGG